jgi:hypothetical protein
MNHQEIAVVELDKHLAEKKAEAAAAYAVYKATLETTNRAKAALGVAAQDAAAEAPVVATQKRRGRKPGSKNKVKVGAIPRAALVKATPKKTAKVKAAPKKTVKAKATPKKTAKSIKAAATEGRRAVASGKRPPLKEAMVTVMGDKECTSEMILAGLKTHGWLPNSENPRGYISYMLSSNKDAFKQTSRGHYKVSASYKPKSKAPKGKAPKAAAVTAPKAAPAKKAATGKPLTLKDAMVAAMGDKECTSEMILDGLKKAGRMPKSGNPRGYISAMLSSNKDAFKQTSRGHYKVVANYAPKSKAPKAVAAPKAAAAPKAKKAAAVAAPKAAPAAAPAPADPNGSGVSPTEAAQMAELGINTAGGITSNPFDTNS